MQRYNKPSVRLASAVIDMFESYQFYNCRVRLSLAFLSLLLFTTGFTRAAVEPKIIPKPETLPTALSDDFQFRKVKLFLLSVTDPASVKARNFATSYNRVQSAPDASLSFERAYRLHGAVTELDKRQRYGHYMDFFWRANRDAKVTVRLEYRQEKLRSFVQTREISYPQAKGTHKTEFAIIGDDYLDDGRIIAWRCLLIADGRIASINRSYMWE